MSESTEKQDPFIGRTIQEYQLLSLLGKGGMGKVYLAKHTSIGKRIAIKVLEGGNQESIERFFREAKIVNEIQHENIVDIFNFIRLAEQGEAYIMMEFLDGQTVSEAIQSDAPFPLQRVGHIGIQVCSALFAAHQQKVIHRDLKPDNIILINRARQRDFVKVLDFGLLKLQGAESLTQRGIALGTPHYMSPEQASGKEVDTRSDIYSFGAILYQMATGTLPFGSFSAGDVMRKQVSEPVTPPRERFAGVSMALEAIILRCLEKSAQARYQTMAELALALGKACHLEAGPYFGDEFSSSISQSEPALLEKLSSGRITGLHSAVASLQYEDAPTKDIVSTQPQADFEDAMTIDAPTAITPQEDLPQESNEALNAAPLRIQKTQGPQGNVKKKALVDGMFSAQNLSQYIKSIEANATEKAAEKPALTTEPTKEVFIDQATETVLIEPSAPRSKLWLVLLVSIITGIILVSLLR